MKFQISLRRLFIGTTFVAAGLALCIPMAHSLAHLWREPGNSLFILLAGLCSLLGGVVLGAGALMPFRNSWLGAIVGFVVQAIRIGMLVAEHSRHVQY